MRSCTITRGYARILLMQRACERNGAFALAPTRCRLARRAARVRGGWAMHEVMLEKFVASLEALPEEVVLDFDTTADPLHRRQEERLFDD